MTAYDDIREVLNQFVGKLDGLLDVLCAKVIAKVLAGKSIEKAADEALKESAFSSSTRMAIAVTIIASAKVGFTSQPKNKIAATPKPETAKLPHKEALKPMPPAVKPGRTALTLTQIDQIIHNKLSGDAWAPDKIDLSHRLHQGQVRQKIVETISASIRNVNTIKDIATKLYDGYSSGKGVLRPAELPKYLNRIKDIATIAVHGDKAAIEEVSKAVDTIRRQVNKLQTPDLKKAYQALLDACSAKELKEAAIKKAAWVAVQEKTRYHAMRIARTESARAWFNGFIAKNQDDPDVWGYKWQLSSRHKYVPFDQCDVCANMNVGFGRGIYPKNKVPFIPRHPHCMCMLVQVYHWEIDDSLKFDPDQATEYINSLDRARQFDLFGKEGLAYYRQGGDWQKLLRGWDGFGEPKSILDKSDFGS